MSAPVASSPTWRRSVIFARPDQNDTIGEPTVKIDTKASDLYRIMNDAIHFASPAIGVPAIESVRIETTPNDADTINLIGVATDRFVLGVSRVTAEGNADAGFTLSTDDAKNVIRLAKTAKRDQAWRRVTISDDEAGRITFAFSSGESVTVATVEADFPRWRQLMVADADAMARPASGLGVDPLKISVFGRIAAAKSSPMALFPGVDEVGRLKAVHVRIGDDFAGLVMPVRAPGDGSTTGPRANLFSYDAPGWL